MKKALLIIALGFLLSGCFPGLSNPGKRAADQPGDFLKGRVAKGFPDLPLYPEAKLAESYGDSESYGASAYTKDEIDKVVKFYDLNLNALGWESTFVQDSSARYTFEIKNQGQRGWVIINTAVDGKTVAITFSVTKR
ncbi:MAG: hypothetical protein UU23_C0007G0003 [Candidatus Curtissbacteria bacterium GW2011_GWA1_40_9]|uniref:Lipoprotein n=1 Tax=Candidatus Curtissbacteria bacterium GW2011_GWA1_40_9 TaxID=1618408 RepID=A0A0G0W0Q6_9BACT|nr:MAG: hypothetical protein UU23_C0007G0003 [Candidatus Curtissbacteria bacterium GW2011_GWA1_40_9]